jgi:hypothetical protein
MHGALGSGIALGVVSAGKRLMHPQGPTGVHDGRGRRLAPIVTQQGHRFPAPA